MKRSMGNKMAMVIGAFACCALGVFAVPSARAAVPSRVVQPARPVVSHVVVRNPHLHGANNLVAEKESLKGRGIDIDPPVRRDAHQAYYHSIHHWHHRWDFVNWVVVHRGLATIRGTVRDNSGGPVADAAVALRGARGRILSAGAKHLTRTGSGGDFAMIRVRAGVYRVRAQVGKMASYTKVALHSGEVAVVDVKL